MRTLLIALILLPLTCFSAHLTCHIGQSVVYSGDIDEFYYRDKLILFTDKKSKHDMGIMAHCTIKT